VLSARPALKTLTFFCLFSDRACICTPPLGLVLGIVSSDRHCGGFFHGLSSAVRVLVAWKQGQLYWVLRARPSGRGADFLFSSSLLLVSLLPLLPQFPHPFRDGLIGHCVTYTARSAFLLSFLPVTHMPERLPGMRGPAFFSDAAGRVVDTFFRLSVSSWQSLPKLTPLFQVLFFEPPSVSFPSLFA